MSLKNQLQQDLKEAIRSQDAERKSVIRMCLSAIQRAEVEQGGELDDPALVAVLQKEAKQRRDAIAQFEGADRPDLLEAEKAELEILESYLPQMLSRDEIALEARQVIEQVDASGMKDLGSVMRVLMPQMKGRAEGRLVNQVVRELLAE
ncbi:MAG: GatB/YqeY domain-containing protein [Anaerolineae bacterium]|jgi:uncharacterized protein YqeY